MIQRVDSLSKTVYERELSLKSAELQAFQAQINPHFLYNTLDCINSLIGMKKAADAQKTVVAMGNLMRMSIKGPTFLTVQEEVRHIEEYLLIQKMRYQDKILFLVEMDPGLSNYKIPKLILQPLLENAIQHGVSDMRSQGMVILLGKIEGDHLVFTVRDNGVGIPESIMEQINQYQTNDFTDPGSHKDRIGLFNIQQRIHLIYGEPYGMTAKRLPQGGTDIMVRLAKQVKE